jgi:surface antigen
MRFAGIAQATPSMRTEPIATRSAARRRPTTALAGLLASAVLTLAGCSTLETANRPAATASSFGATPNAPSASTGSAKIEALLGAGFGNSLGPGDLDAAYQAQIQALEGARPGTAVTWSNPRTGNRGEIVPGPTYIVNSLECRDFSHIVQTSAGRDVRQGAACRRSDGAWQAIA